MPLTFRQAVRDTFSGAIIYAGRYTAESGARLLESGLADLIAFGRPFMANPDLPARIANGWPLNALNPATVYGGGAEGYTDYPHTAANPAICARFRHRRFSFISAQISIHKLQSV